MRNVVYACMLVAVMVGCASERSKRTTAQMLSPDRLNMQIHVDPDIRDDVGVISCAFRTEMILKFIRCD